jgi:hypothetical protein
MQPGKLLHPYTNNIAPKIYKRNKDNLKLSSSEIKAISTLSQDWIFAYILQLQQMGINQNTLFTLLDTNKKKSEYKFKITSKITQIFFLKRTKEARWNL